jgi:type I restriction enzyme S subunit
MISPSQLPGLPTGWKWAKLAEACQYLPTGMGEFDGKREYYSTGSIIGDQCTPEGSYSFSERPSRANRMSKTGDVFQARMAQTDKAVLITNNLNDRLFSTGFIQLRPFNCCKEIPSYLYYYLKSPLFFNQRDMFATGSTQVALTDNSAAFINFPIAPYEEQRRIVAKIEEFLTKLDAGIEALNLAKLRLKRYRQAVLKDAFEGKLTAAWREKHQGELEFASILLGKIKARQKKIGKYKELLPPDTTDLPVLPETWKWVQAEGLCHFITKGTTPTSDKLFSEHGEIPFIKVYNLTDRGLLDFKVNPTFINRETHCRELARSKIFAGDVLMNIVGPPLGKISIVPNLYPEWNTNQAIAIFRPLIGYNNILLSYTLMNNIVLSWAKKRAKATVGQFNLTLEICRALPLPLPPFDEQTKIVEEIDRHFSIADSLEKTIETSLKESERLRQSILKFAFEGKLVPQDPRDEPAERLLVRIKAERIKMLGVKSKSRKKSGHPQERLV